MSASTLSRLLCRPLERPEEGLEIFFSQFLIKWPHIFWKGSNHYRLFLKDKELVAAEHDGHSILNY